MKKIIVIILTVAVFGILFTAQVRADTEFTYSQAEDDSGEIYSELYSGIVGDSLSDIPNEAKEFIYDYDLSPENPLSFENIFSKDTFTTLLSRLRDYMLTPIKSAALLLSAIMLCALITGFKPEEQRGVQSALKSFSSLAAFAVIMLQITTLITDCANVLSSLSVFMTSLVPVFAGILIAASKGGTSLGFQTPVFIATQSVSYLGTYIVTPFSSMFLALSVAAGVSGDKRLFGIAEMLKKAAMWTMSISMTVYMAVFSIKNVITSGTDTATSRTARFLVSSFVPIVGVSVNEALSSMKSCVGILRSSVGIYVVIIMLCVIVPLLVRLIFWRAVLGLCSSAANMLCVENIGVLLKAVTSSLSVLTAVVICCGVMFIFSVTVLCFAAGGV